MFWFKTRRQYLNSPQGDCLARIDFTSKLQYFHRKSGTSFTKTPMIDKRPLDLFHLHQYVQLRGGYTNVCRKKMWAQIGRELGYNGKIMTSLSTSLKSAYQKYVLAYDEFLIKSGIIVSQNEHDSPGNGVFPEFYHILNSDYSPKSLLEKFGISESTIDENNDRFNLLEKNHFDPENEENGVFKTFRLSNGVDLNLLIYNDITKYPFVSNSKSKNSPSTTVRNAHATFHRFQRHHPLQNPNQPHSDENYVQNLEEVSNETRDLPSYNLRQFQQKAQVFHGIYAKSKHLLEDNLESTENDIEKEYWSMLSENLDFEVEYGADIHTSIHGSPFPQAERDAQSLDCNDPWNLNSIPFNRESFFRFVDTPISSMIQPWLYIGMLFSTQAWNCSDFYSYWLSYCHFGDLRTWYTVPESDSEKFQNLLLSLLKNNPKNQSLFNSDLMISPETLKNHGIKCYAIDQRPGQIVVNFPKSYHSHFNHGFNLVESVNLLPMDDWLPYGRMCGDLFKMSKLEPPFCIDKMLVKMMEDDETRLCSLPVISLEVLEMCQKEQSLREIFFKSFSHIRQIQESEDCHDLDYLSTFSNQYSYLSRVVNSETGSIFTLEEMLQNPDTVGDVSLIIRVSDKKLKNLIGLAKGLNATTIKEDQDCKIETDYQVSDDLQLQVNAWTERYVNHLKQNIRPSLEILRDLYIESQDMISLSPSGLNTDTLRQFLREADKWILDARPLLRHIDSLAKNWARTGPLNISELQRLANELQLLPFESSETKTIEKWATEVQAFLDGVYGKIDYSINENCPELLKSGIIGRGRQLGIDVNELEKWTQQATWLGKFVSRKAIEGIKGFKSEEITNLLSEGCRLGIYLDEQANLPTLPPINKHSNRQEPIILPPPKSFPLPHSEMPFSGRMSGHSISNMANAYAKFPSEEALENQIKGLLTRPRDQTVSFHEAQDLLKAGKQANLEPLLIAELERRVLEVEQWQHEGVVLFGLGTEMTLEQWMPILWKAVIPTSRSWEEGQVYCLCRMERRNSMIMCESCNEWYHCACLKDRGYGIPESTPGKKPCYRCPICTSTLLDSNARITYRFSEDGKERAIEVNRVSFSDFIKWAQRWNSLSHRPRFMNPNDIVEFMAVYQTFITNICSDKGWSQLSLKVLMYHLRKLEGALIDIKEEKWLLDSFLSKRLTENEENSTKTGKKRGRKKKA